uniref:Glycine-rich cell wall structural protein 2-like n=1 Tax=Strongyloides stercoralis TaxID=6248 RepID=A0A0K0DVN3_STRER
MKTTSIIIFALGASTASAGFFGTAPWIGGNSGYENHGREIGDVAGSFGGFGKANGGFNGAWDGKEGAHAVGDAASQAGATGHNQWANGASDFAKDAAVSHGEAAGNSAARAAQDSAGAKKYAYFTQGSGPDGFYSKGYYGSNGFEHEAAKAGANANAQGAGYQKAFAAGDAGSSHGGKFYDKAATARDGFGRGYDRAGYGGQGAAYGTDNFGNAFNKGYGALEGASGEHTNGLSIWG